MGKLLGKLEIETLEGAEKYGAWYGRYKTCKGLADRGYLTPLDSDNLRSGYRITDAGRVVLKDAKDLGK